MLVTSHANAALACKAAQPNLHYNYTFNHLEGENLEAQTPQTRGNKKITDLTTTAVHTSIIKNTFIDETRIGESFYYIVHAKQSLTELISLSQDLTVMVKAGPTKNTANFLQLNCKGGF